MLRRPAQVCRELPPRRAREGDDNDCRDTVPVCFNREHTVSSGDTVQVVGPAPRSDADADADAGIAMPSAAR